jgi:hypothetical protein
MARQKATEAKLLVTRGIHPVEQSNAEKDARAALEVQSKHELDAKKYTFEVAAEQYIDSKRAEWRNKKNMLLNGSILLRQTPFLSLEICQ